jgi:hypothetical protein
MPIWAYSTSMGELNSMSTRFRLGIAWQRPQDNLPALPLSVCLRERRRATYACRFRS